MDIPLTRRVVNDRLSRRKHGMHAHRDVPLKVAFEGLIAGIAGALALSGMVATSRTLMSAGNTRDGSAAEAGITAAQALAEGPHMPRI